MSLRRGANSKRGAYLKLGANSSIFCVNLETILLPFSFTENVDTSNEDLVEGDMIIPTEQRLELILGQSRGAHKLRRWPNGVVPYTIDWSLGMLSGDYLNTAIPRRL